MVEELLQTGRLYIDTISLNRSSEAVKDKGESEGSRRVTN